jgi:hypothetical protein
MEIGCGGGRCPYARNIVCISREWAMSKAVWSLPGEGDRTQRSEDREARLLEIRRRAAESGNLEVAGVHPAGAPFPIASAETGYYGIPLLKQPQWTNEIPIYFFVGGITGASAVIGAVANWTGKNAKIVRDSRYVAAGGALLSSALLISDLGRPARFLAMLRIFKPQSPMSVGAWVLAAFGTFSGASAAAQFFADRYRVGTFEIIGNVTEGFAALFGLPLATYTGVLLGVSVIPVWNHNVQTLPLHFGMSGLNSAVSTLELLGNDRSPALNRLGILASGLETYEGFHLEMRQSPVVNQPLKHRKSGWMTRIGGVLSGPVPLALRIAAEFTSADTSRRLRRTAAVSSLTGSIFTRFGWVSAGHASAKDWRLPLQQKTVAKVHKTQSQLEHPKLRALERIDGEAASR